MSRPGAWWRHWWAWTIPALLLAANLAWVFGFRSAVLERGSALAAQAEQLQSEVARLEESARRLEDTRARLGELRENLRVLRRDQLAGMKERLIPFLQEVLRLAQEAGLGVESIGYAYKREEKSGLVYFTASYSVKGSYEQIRRCVFLLESSPQFIVLEGLGLEGDQSAASLDVSVRLTMGTYFSEVDEALVRELGAREVKGGSED
ncbi:MAG TPA: type 4a pilus biogenesis protein PilO [Thermoanaerobaculaceae bacterium]|nr:type 4a pilus biogenesis protein PilO [Thermoanaerobaculaceae bacterium]HRS16095.1 type 4a pilus biogenesis protein PilO [Thermoanaerobaculaceae bacterium]